MGVHGLWKLIESAGKPVPVETLDNKILAVDVSIWLHQLMKGYQAPSGSNLSNAYLLGLFTRVCKLLFTNVKPVFVFDGGVPQLKRKTIAARQKQRNKAEQVSEKLREQLLRNLLKQKAVGQVLEEIRGQTSPKKKPSDMFELPPLPEAEESPSDVEEMSNSSSEEDVKPFKMKFKDLHSIDVNSAEFKSLPADMRHDILSELKETRKQSSWGRIHEMPEESGDFSNYQMSRLLKRRSVQVSLEAAEKEMGGRTLSLGDVEALLAEGGVEINPQLTKRIASDEATRYIYVRETGEQSKAMGNDALMKCTSVNNEDSSVSKGLDPNVVIKEEVIENDELSDLEIIQEIEAIEMSYKVKEEQESDTEGRNENIGENVEFGTEDMFENQINSEGTTMYEIDSIKDNSGLSQSQILEIIKQQNVVSQSGPKKVDPGDSLPSTSKHCLQNIVEKQESASVYTMVGNSNSNHTKTILEEPLKPSTASDSKILDSIYFKMSKNVQSVLSKQNEKTNLVNKIKNVKMFLGKNTKSNNKEIVHFDSPDLSALYSKSSESENETSIDLDSISDVRLQHSKRDVSLSKNKQDKTLEYKSAMQTNTSTALSSSESDDEFLEVPNAEEKEMSATVNRLTEPQKKELHIQIQPVQTQIEGDIFADIFMSVGQTSESNRILGNTSITKMVDDDQRNNLKNKEVLIYKNNNTELTDKPIKQKTQVHLITHTQKESKENTKEIKEDSYDKDKSENTKSFKLNLSKSVESNVSGSVDEESSSRNCVNTNTCSSTIFDNNGTSISSTSLTSSAISTYIDHQDSDDSISVDDPPNLNPEGATKSVTPKEEKPKRKLNTKQLEKLQDILETKERELVLDQNREDRIATSLTDQMYQEAQELLRLFGLPYVVAPMEAEAQCAFLDSAGLTQGTITDDSDIWLFGGKKVYKNFFDQKKFVLEYKSNDIQQYFRLSRSHLVLLALLVGSDYTVGLQGVGAVTALEILATFPPSQPDTQDPNELLSCLDKFKQWWESKRHTNGSLAKKLKNIDLSLGFPSSAVVTAYLQPMIDDSREVFSWGSPDLPGIRDYAERKFGWNRSRTDQILQPVVNRMAQKTSQLTLHTFFGAVPNITAHREQMSRRVQSAVNRLAGGEEEFIPVQPRPRQSRGRGQGRGGSVPVNEGRGMVRGRGKCLLDNHESCIGSGCNASTDVIPQREKDKMEALKRKEKAIEIIKNKKRKGIKKRNNVRQIKSEANLSESSSEDN